MKCKKTIMAILMTLVLSSPVYSKCDEQKALALNMYHEAKGESLEGKLMVAEVVINRVESKRFPKSICGVIYEKGQFEWVSRKLAVNDTETFENIMDLSGEILDGKVELPGTDALFFKSKGFKSNFHSKRKYVGTVGKHEFFK